MRYKWALFFIVLLCCAITITTTQPVEPVAGQQDDVQSGKDFLNVTKTVKPKEAWVDQNVTVTIEIKNAESVNETIFDLKVTEEDLPFWSFAEIDAGNVSVIDGIELGVKENVTGYYVLRPLKSGNYTLPGAKITFKDENETNYELFTEPVNLNVLPKITTEDWRNVLLLCIAAVGIPGVPWTILYFTKRKTYKTRKKRK
ncbi:MAG: BatD family protein [Promethearchaeota archaeon]